MDRYAALGITNFDNLCNGLCEGTGFIPVYLNKTGTQEKGNAYPPNETNMELLDLWWDAEMAKPAEDGWHFVKCPTCKGTGKKI